MAGSFHSILLHIVFSTHQRRPFLIPGRRELVFAYIAGILRRLGCDFVVVNGHVEHVHVVCSLPANLSPQELVRRVKSSSSKWLHEEVEGLQDFQWQRGYAAFSFSRRQLSPVCRYVERQEDHHSTTSFEEEYRDFLKLAQIEFDDRYLLG
ncbi:MAG: IS200/IS605 family transposase [Bryobacterales bacterium]|nr:IS200/IS605 family transposase [Bryobacterales bacterium]